MKLALNIQHSVARLNKPKTEPYKLIYFGGWYLAFRYWNIVTHGNQSAEKPYEPHQSHILI